MGSLSLPAPSWAARRRQRQRAAHVPVVVLGAVIAVVVYLQFVLLPGHVFSTPPASVASLAESRRRILDEGLQQCHRAQAAPIEHERPVSSSTRSNSRWNARSGQNDTVVLRDARLFDGLQFTAEPVDVVFSKGVIQSVTPSSQRQRLSLDWVDGDEDGVVVAVDLGGSYVTPGLVDMHSHHLTSSWPTTRMTVDDNEVHEETGPLTPFVRALDGMKPYDTATAQIASGGVTTSLILPGSANIMGGEAYPVKNVVEAGEHGEQVVEEMLLEHGIARPDRRRYLKMACGENPKRVYSHTRMGNAWKFRQHMAKGASLKAQQDAWCLAAEAARDTADVAAIEALTKDGGGFPEEMELDSTVAMLRGQININVHCYEVEDFEDMLLHSEEFGFRIAAFHHALSAWKVPELIKASGQNITVATFSDFGLYKKEAYDASLYAGKILAEHGVPVAYKSDHVEQRTSAKYLLFQAAHAHHFGLPADLALQSVTSVPATSMQQDHRIGFARPGYDADLVVWDSHPLSLGATPLQVYIDGKPTLDENAVKDSLAKKFSRSEEGMSEPPPKMEMEAVVDVAVKENVCAKVKKPGERVVFTDISTIYSARLDQAALEPTVSAKNDLVLIVENGQLICSGDVATCPYDGSTTDTVVKLRDGHVLPGVVAYTEGLGLIEIEDAPETGDGVVGTDTNPFDPDSVVYAKYGVHLDGKPFERARIGGVMRAITAPLMNKGLVRGVSTGIKTSGNITSLENGIFQEDVALHFTIGQGSKGAQRASSVSAAVGNMRKILTSNKSKDNIYGSAADGALPVVVSVENKYDILQMVKLKADYPQVNLVLAGASEAHLVADELAKSGIPVIITAPRGHPDTFEKREVLSGPPMTRSLVQILHEAGVEIALANGGEGAPMGASFIQNLLLEASWAAQYAGLSDSEAIGLVQSQFEKILGLPKSKSFVVYDGNPLEFGSRVVYASDGEEDATVECWPETM